MAEKIEVARIVSNGTSFTATTGAPVGDTGAGSTDGRSGGVGTVEGSLRVGEPACGTGVESVWSGMVCSWWW
jgi:hypothetical protein